MATKTDEKFCVTCKKTKNTVKCSGCSTDFCSDHIVEHRNELSEQLNTIEDQFNELKIRIAGQNVKQQKHELMKQIDEWEYESIEKIRQVANEVRRELSLSVTKVVTDLDFKLNRLTEQIVKFRKDEDIAETDIQVFNEELQRLKTNLKNSLNFK
ncbi:unnamed protein product [Rotaria sp. Silwood2]|nr:unnamed protein product [Rotaria sp. Silwood2]